MWDARKLKLPVKVFDGLPAARQSGVCFSPDESLIVTGVAMISPCTYFVSIDCSFRRKHSQHVRGSLLRGGRAQSLTACLLKNEPSTLQESRGLIIFSCEAKANTSLDWYILSLLMDPIQGD